MNIYNRKEISCVCINYLFPVLNQLFILRLFYCEFINTKLVIYAEDYREICDSSYVKTW